MSKKKPARPARKTAKMRAPARKPERSKGELSSDDLDSVAGGTLWATPPPPIAGGGADDVAASSSSLSYSKFKIAYTEQDQSTGTVSGPDQGAWPMGKKK
jgi:hypothetical protein